MTASPEIALWEPQTQSVIYQSVDEDARLIVFCWYGDATSEENWIRNSVVLHKGQRGQKQSAALRETYSRLDRMKDLRANWDDEGADPVDAKAIKRAKEFVSDRAEEGIDPHFIVAGKDGGIILEYRNNLISAEVEIAGDPAELARLIVFDDAKVLYDGVFDYGRFFNLLQVVPKNTGDSLL